MIRLHCCSKARYFFFYKITTPWANSFSCTKLSDEVCCKNCTNFQLAIGTNGPRKFMTPLPIGPKPIVPFPCTPFDFVCLFDTLLLWLRSTFYLLNYKIFFGFSITLDRKTKMLVECPAFGHPMWLNRRPEFLRKRNNRS